MWFWRHNFWLETRKNPTEDVACSVLQDISGLLFPQHSFDCNTLNFLGCFLCSKLCSKHHLRIAVQLPASLITVFYSRYFHIHYVCGPFLEMEFQKKQSGVCCSWRQDKDMSITIRFSKLQSLRCRGQYLWYFFCQIKILLTTVC